MKVIEIVCLFLEWCKIRKGVHDVIDDAAMASNAVMLAEKIFLREAAADGPLPREKLLSKCFMKIEFSFPFSKKRFYKTAATIFLSALDHLFLPL